MIEVKPKHQALYDLVHRELKYDPRTGDFKWKLSRRGVRKGHFVGCINDSGYKIIRLRRKTYKIHRLVWLYHHGWLPELVDHKDHDRSNSRIENLRAVTHSENNANTDLRSDNKCGYKGVSFHKGSRSYVSKLRGRTLGYFRTPELAAKCYETAARAEFGIHFNDTSGQKTDRRRY